MKLKRFCAGLSLMTLLTGCYQCMDSYDEFCCHLRNEHAAKEAWHEWKECFDEEDDSCFGSCDFERGFKDGYCGVCEGGDGKVPLLPPRRYWGPRYQGFEGKQQTLGWFRGYSHGAIAADQDGVGEWSNLATSRTGHPQPVAMGGPQQYPHGMMMDGGPVMPYNVVPPGPAMAEPGPAPEQPPMAPPVDAPAAEAAPPAYDPYRPADEVPGPAPGPQAMNPPMSMPAGEFTLPLVPGDAPPAPEGAPGHVQMRPSASVPPQDWNVTR